jgi:excinuclease ABC subunit C
MSKEEIQATLKNLPGKPGVYRYYASDNTLLYVGKAKNLKKRVSSYFQNSKVTNARMTLMVSQIDRIEYTIVDSEKESLILESNLIHSLQPKYNVLLKDDKNYVYVRVTSDPIPSIDLVRRKYDPRSTYFGPYTRKSGIYETLRVLRQIFPYCQEKTQKPRPCEYYGIKLCDGICIGKEDKEEYKEKIKQIKNVLDGKTEEVEDWLNNKIQHAVSVNNFGLAALWRDRISIMKDTIGTQKMILPQPDDVNLLSLVIYKDEEGMLIGSIFVEYIKAGKVVNVLNSILSGSSDEIIDEEGNENYRAIAVEFISRFLQNIATYQPSQSPYLVKSYFIDAAADLKKGIVYSNFNDDSNYISLTQADTKLLEEVSSLKVQQKYTLDNNKKEIAKLFKHNILNAYNYLVRNKNQERLNLFEENNLYKNLLELKSRLGLQNTPRRIECYDISHISGKFVYGSMVTFFDGRPAKKWYRLFKTKDQNNDFANMQEVLTRRIKRYFDSQGKSTEKGWDKPDLIIIDGGKGQLSSVVKAIAEINQELTNENMCFDSEICSLAKKEELIFLPDDKEPIAMEGETRFLIQRIRDEAHRFAITNNRNARIRTASKSELDTIPGIGGVTKTKALKAFGSVKGLVESLDNNQELVIEKLGKKVTETLKKHYGIQ